MIAICQKPWTIRFSSWQENGSKLKYPCITSCTRYLVQIGADTSIVMSLWEWLTVSSIHETRGTLPFRHVNSTGTRRPSLRSELFSRRVDSFRISFFLILICSFFFAFRHLFDYANSSNGGQASGSLAVSQSSVIELDLVSKFIISTHPRGTHATKWAGWAPGSEKTHLFCAVKHNRYRCSVLIGANNDIIDK